MVNINKFLHPAISVVQGGANRFFEHFLKTITMFHNDTLAQNWYGVVQPGYKDTPEKGEEEIRTESLDWVMHLSEKLDDIKDEVFLSGALGLSLATDTYPRPHANTDLAFKASSELLENLVNKLKKDNFYLFWRISNSLNDPATNTDIKYHLYYPVNNVNNAVNRKGLITRNLELVKVDINERCIDAKFVPETRIRLYPHYGKTKTLICKEDAKTIPYPFDLFNGFPFDLPNGNYIRIINQDYWRLKLKSIIFDERNTKEKHIIDYKRNNDFLDVIKNSHVEAVAV